MANLNSVDRAKGASVILLIAAIIGGFLANSEWGWLAGVAVAVALYALAWVIDDPSQFR